MQTRRHSTTEFAKRGGWLAPIVALALVVVLGAVALVLDRLWLDMATSEAEGVADTAALAAARELASDDALRVPAPESDARIAAAKLAAENVASMNHIAGQAHSLDTEAGDLVFGVKLLVEDTGEIQFVETAHEPRCVRVTIQRTRARGNPVALFLTGLTKVSTGEVRGDAEATIDNHVVGLQTVSDARVPVLPLAILANDPAGKRLDTWQVQIDKRMGEDNYRYDPSTREVQAGSDGIPEIVLTPANPSSTTDTVNMAFFDVHGRAGQFNLEEQISLGLSSQDLERRDGRLVFLKGPERFPAYQSLTKKPAAALQSIVGQCRAVLLYQNWSQPDRNAPGHIDSAGLVAGRIMSVQTQSNGGYKLVFQPGVLATHSALVPSDLGIAETTAPPNKYLYQLKLTQ